MIIDIKKAIVHILDCNSGAAVFSEEEIDVGEPTINAYLCKHIEKIYDDAGMRKGEFTAQSGFKYHMGEYLEDKISFANFSLFAAERMYENIKNSENIESCDVVVCECIIKEKRTIAVMKFDNKAGFVHHVNQQEGRIKNEILNHYAILPSMSHKINQAAFVDCGDFSIRYKGKKITVDGEKVDLIADALLECVFDISAKESFNAVRKIAKKIADEYGAEQIETEARMKKYVKHTSAEDGDIKVEEMAETVFEGLVSARADFVEKSKEANVPECFEANEYIYKRVNANIRLVTDKGIEILFPSEYYKDEENISIINNDDGTISVQINNISKLTNK